MFLFLFYLSASSFTAGKTWQEAKREEELGLAQSAFLLMNIFKYSE